MAWPLCLHNRVRCEEQQQAGFAQQRPQASHLLTGLHACPHLLEMVQIEALVPQGHGGIKSTRAV